jgi:hypothetical protein
MALVSGLEAAPNNMFKWNGIWQKASITNDVIPHSILKSDLYGAESFLKNHQPCSYLLISQQFMEPIASLLCSKEPYTSSYPETYQFCPYHSMISLQNPF